MKIIAAVDRKWGIGKNNKLLVNIPEDMKLFRQETMGKVVVMGRKTFEGLSSQSGLEGRMNVVLTRNKDFKSEGVTVCRSLEELFSFLQPYNTDDVYVAGGGEIYELMLPYCDTAHITKIDYVYDSDCFFPNLDLREEWKIAGSSDEHTYFDLCYEFVCYKNTAVSVCG